MEPTQYKCDPYWYNVGLLHPLVVETLHTEKDFFFFFFKAKPVFTFCHVAGGGTDTAHGVSL